MRISKIKQVGQDQTAKWSYATHTSDVLNCMLPLGLNLNVSSDSAVSSNPHSKQTRSMK